MTKAKESKDAKPNDKAPKTEVADAGPDTADATEDVEAEEEEDAATATVEPTGCIYVKGSKVGAKNAKHHLWGEYHTIVVSASEAKRLLKEEGYAAHPQEFAPKAKEE